MNCTKKEHSAPQERRTEMFLPATNRQLTTVIRAARVEHSFTFILKEGKMQFVHPRAVGVRVTRNQILMVDVQ